MNVDFWQKTWETNQIGFHESQPNPLLLTNVERLELAKGSRVFLPLCGKTLDIAWLLTMGYRVVGAELSEIAIEQLFKELGVEPDITALGNISRYSANNIDIFVGDFFNLSHDVIGSVDAIYDRAALVALPETMREKYTKHLLEITDAARQLLITFEYNQRLMDGPPFSLSSDEVNQHYKDTYHLSLLETISVPSGLKGGCPATESIWLLNNT